MSKNPLITLEAESIRTKIYTIRNIQVMLDSDLAEIYGVETKILNRAVKRNIERFPEKFRFQLTDEESKNLRCQIGTSSSEFLRSQSVTLNDNSLRCQFGSLNNEALRLQIATLKKGRGKHRKYIPYVFTEQGVAMLSAVLRSSTAVEVSIKIIDAFVEMRRFIQNNAEVFMRLDSVERRQIAFASETDKKFEKIFNAIEAKEIKPKQGIFFEGQIFDAYTFVSDLIRKAQKSIILIDNYVDETVLTILSKRKKNTTAVIYTKSISKQLQLDLDKHNSQYPKIEIKEFPFAHDRFLILDKENVYHIGASLKDLGKKWFAFSKIEKDALRILDRLEGER